jgi:hypothetical protein
MQVQDVLDRASTAFPWDRSVPRGCPYHHLYPSVRWDPNLRLGDSVPSNHLVPMFLHEDSADRGSISILDREHQEPVLAEAYACHLGWSALVVAPFVTVGPSDPGGFLCFAAGGGDGGFCSGVA